MPQTASQRNPFMLMLNPELVLAAIEKSERLEQLNRHMCRPLDRIPAGVDAGEEVSGDASPEARGDQST